MMTKIRAATIADAEAIATIFNAYLGKATMVLSPRSAKDYAAIINAEETVVYVGLGAENQIAGFAYVKPYSDRGGYRLAGEVTIFIAENVTGSNLGSKLYDQLIPLTDTLGYRHLTAKIWANNTGSIRFHKRYGFRLVGTQVGIGWVNGKRVDTVIMEKAW